MNRVAPHIEKLAWEAVWTRNEFTSKQLRLAYPMSAAVAQAIIRRWLAAGQITFLRRGEYGQHYYAPVAGASLPPDLTGRTPADNMWTAMRRQKSYTVTDIAAHATTEAVPVTTEMARDYIRSLMTAGFVRALRLATAEQEALYVTTKKSLIKAPVVRRIRVVEDPNTGAIHHLERGR
jgi:hypothetical protein